MAPRMSKHLKYEYMSHQSLWYRHTEMYAQIHFLTFSVLRGIPLLSELSKIHHLIHSNSELCWSDCRENCMSWVSHFHSFEGAIEIITHWILNHFGYWRSPSTSINSEKFVFLSVLLSHQGTIICDVMSVAPLRKILTHWNYQTMHMHSNKMHFFLLQTSKQHD